MRTLLTFTYIIHHGVRDLNLDKTAFFFVVFSASTRKWHVYVSNSGELMKWGDNVIAFLHRNQFFNSFSHIKLISEKWDLFISFRELLETMQIFTSTKIGLSCNIFENGPICLKYFFRWSMSGCPCNKVGIRELCVGIPVSFNGHKHNVAFLHCLRTHLTFTTKKHRKVRVLSLRTQLNLP